MTYRGNDDALARVRSIRGGSPLSDADDIGIEEGDPEGASDDLSNLSGGVDPLGSNEPSDSDPVARVRALKGR